MKIRVSTGSAVLLGLKDSRLDARPTTLYTLSDGECQGNCGFCPQARSVRGEKKWLSRVSWPSYNLEEVFPPTEGFQLPREIQRICLQSILEPDWIGKVSQVVAYLKEIPYLKDIPISLSARPGTIEEARELYSIGIERLGLPLDVANPDLYQKIKGGSFDKTNALLEGVAAEFPGRLSTHLIIGLGESEEEAARLLVKFQKSGVLTGLFAFTPAPRTSLANWKQPPLGHYRRLQVLRYLLFTGQQVELTFDVQGRIIDYGWSIPDLRELLASGEAFRTSGCPGCNRPYYNERPGQVPYNYPRPLTDKEIAQAISEVYENAK